MIDDAKSNHPNPRYPMIKKKGKRIKSRNNTTTLLLGYHHRQTDICKNKQRKKIEIPINKIGNFIYYFLSDSIYIFASIDVVFKLSF